MLFDARAGGELECVDGLRLLGAGGDLLVPSDRILVRGEGERRCGEQGLSRQPGWRRGDDRRARPLVDPVRYVRHRRAERGPGRC